MSAIIVEHHITLTRIQFDADVDHRLDDAGEPDYAGWYCLRTAPYPCPAEGCDFVALFATVAHRIVVWPERDDRALLKHAALCARAGRDPHVVEWEPHFGPCVSFYLWQRVGRPVHGVATRPSGWPGA